MFPSARRLPWLLVNMVVGLISALIVTQFEDTIAQVAVLAALMPIIAGGRQREHPDGDDRGCARWRWTKSTSAT